MVVYAGGMVLMWAGVVESESKGELEHQAGSNSCRYLNKVLPKNHVSLPTYGDAIIMVGDDEQKINLRGGN